MPKIPNFQSSKQIQVPDFKDSYSKTVKKLESNNFKKINFKKFRESFIDSIQFFVASENYLEISYRESEICKFIENNQYIFAIRFANEILSIDYTNLYAHKTLEVCYEFQKDTKNEKKHKFIHDSLLDSILKSGDGKSIETAYVVTQRCEENYVLCTKGKFFEQLFSSKNGIYYDKFTIYKEDGLEDYYFNINLLMKGNRKLGIGLVEKMKMF